MAKRKAKRKNMITKVHFECCPICATDSIKELRGNSINIKRLGPQIFVTDKSEESTHQALYDLGYHTKDEDCRKQSLYTISPYQPEAV